MTDNSPIASLNAGLLTVSHGNELYWEVSGNRKGKPALYLHGGPGSGLRSGSYRCRFNPQKYFIVGIDLSGMRCEVALSQPTISRSCATIRTQTLIEDIEAVRRHLEVEAWLVSGGVWEELALAYAQAHPDRVSELVLVAVTTTSREEVDWITEGVGRIFPEAWQRFERNSARRDGERIVEAYARRLATGDMQDRLRAARSWNDWESTHVSLDPNWEPIDRYFDEKEAVVFATLVTHFWSNDGFLEEWT